MASILQFQVSLYFEFQELRNVAYCNRIFAKEKHCTHNLREFIQTSDGMETSNFHLSQQFHGRIQSRFNKNYIKAKLIVFLNKKEMNSLAILTQFNTFVYWEHIRQEVLDTFCLLCCVRAKTKHLNEKYPMRIKIFTMCKRNNFSSFDFYGHGNGNRKWERERGSESETKKKNKTQ